jgi:hypothetical protein
MHSLHRISAWGSRGFALALGLALAGTLLAFGNAPAGSRGAVQAQSQLDATIFSYDGKDFIRTHTTLRTQDGKSAVNTKLDHNTPAYRALIQKHSYSGNATAFGRTYDAYYAPLSSSDGRITGALFVAIPK